MKISLVQCKLVMGDLDKNYEIIEFNIREAIKENPDVIVLPELWNTNFFPKNVKEIAEKNGDRAKKFLSRLSKEFHVNIVGGSVANYLEGKLYNTTYIYDREGNLVSSYNKVHLFTPSGEDDYFEFGQEESIFELDGIKCGNIICFDVRFTEWVRTYALKGIEILFVPAAWPAIRVMHWDTLNRARAIENQMFVACVNSVGDMGGHSAIIDPWGEYIVKPDDEEGIKTGEIDLSVIKNIRESINVFRDRRPELYKI